MGQNVEKFHYGQGEVQVARWNGNTPPGPNDWIKLWDVGALSLALTRESLTHKESRTGSKLEVREWANGQTCAVNATINAVNTHNLGLVLSSTPQDIAGGSISGKALPTGVEVGDLIILDHVGVSALVVTDSAGAPVTIANSNFEIAGGYGQFEVKSLPSGPAPTQPLNLAYTYAAARAVGILADTNSAKVALRYNGINLAENGEPVVVDLWKLSLGVLSEFALINNDAAVSGMPFTAKVLADMSRPQTALGYFGQIRYVGTDY